MSVKIEKKILKEFLDEVIMVGDSSLSELVLKFDEEGLMCHNITNSNTTLNACLLKKDVFTEYEKIGKIGITDALGLKTVLNRFDKIVELNKDGNVLELKSGNKKVEITITADEFVKKDEDVVNQFNKLKENIKPEDSVVLETKVLNDIFSDVKINKDSEVIIETEKSLIKFTNSGKYKFTNNVSNERLQGNVKVKFGSVFVDALELINKYEENVKLEIATDKPAIITVSTDKKELCVIVAPRVEN